MRFIYIPLWLDLLFSSIDKNKLRLSDLHSTMVRFIISKVVVYKKGGNKFTFHYG